MAKYYISLGANLGDCACTIGQAIDRLRHTDGITVTAAASLYNTPPWGKTDQPPFINTAVCVETDKTGPDLLSCCQAIESSLGRVRHETWGPRVIDLDIVYSPDGEWHRPNLDIPHPYLTERAFVLVPLQEIAPNLVIRGKAVAQWIAALPDADTIQKRR